MTLSLVVVDAFTDRRFSGNPAAVAVVDAPLEPELMQFVAAEMNLSETAFVAPRSDGRWDLRWFTPSVEVDLCGHATLAATHVLDRACRFLTRSGELTCEIERGRITMDFPSIPSRPAELPGPLDVDGVVDVRASDIGLLVVAETASVVRTFVPDQRQIVALGAPLLLTAAGDRDGIDCVSRFFAPTKGIAEDPVTGSAHCVLAPYWRGRTGRGVLVGEQASRRGGIVEMTLDGDRVRLAGRAVTSAHVEMMI